MPALPRAWVNRIETGALPVLFDGCVYDDADSLFGDQPDERGASLTLTWENADEEQRGSYVMVSMTPLQARFLVEAIQAKLDRHARNEEQGVRVQRVIQSDPELERLLAEEEAIEADLRRAAPTTSGQAPVQTALDPAGMHLPGECGTCDAIRRAAEVSTVAADGMTGPEARPADPTLAEVQSALRMSGPMRYERTPPSDARPRYYRDPQRTIPVQVRPLP